MVVYPDMVMLLLPTMEQFLRYAPVQESSVSLLLRLYRARSDVLGMRVVFGSPLNSNDNDEHVEVTQFGQD